MTIIIQSKTRYSGTVTPSALNTETIVVDIPVQADDYMVEGYLDLSQLQSGDTVVVTEYISVDGVNYQRFAQVTYSNAQSEPIIRFHSKTLLSNMLYRVTIKQSAGTLRSFPYGFIVLVMGSA
ncbi:MAG: hypothetical protein QW733_02070 [Desulfurococcaceae archaeon]|uniref:hypothetical protein n=1 Tax=Desulfurococcus sp. TaxID=51678 RepID=UPI0031607642